MNVRRALVVAVVTASAALVVPGCSSSSDSGGGAVTNLDEVGPQIARLQHEVDALREEVRLLAEQLATVTTTTTAPPR